MRVLRKILSLALACALTLSMGATAWAAGGIGGDVGGGTENQHQVRGIHNPDGTHPSKSTNEEKPTVAEFTNYLDELNYTIYGEPQELLDTRFYTIKLRLGDTALLHLYQGDYAMNGGSNNHEPAYKNDTGVLGIEMGDTTMQGYLGSIKMYCTDMEITAEKVGEVIILYQCSYSFEPRAYKVIVSEDPNNADLSSLAYSIDGGDAISVDGFKRDKLVYDVELPLGSSSLPLGFSSVITLEATPASSTAKVDLTDATPQNLDATAKVTSGNGEVSNTYIVKFHKQGDAPTPPDPTPDPTPDNDKPSSGGSGGGGGSNNSANKPETTEKISDTVAALKDPKATLPAGVTKTTTAGGASISTIPVPMVSGSATVGMDLFNSIGSAPANVGVKFSVSAGLTGGSMEVIIPGGFGKITEPGRIGYSMDFSPKAENNDTMLKAVKGDNATSTTAKIGGNYTLPVTATVTVATKVADGTTINIYKYDPVTGKFITVGKAVAKDGKLTFGTKLMGEMLFTTGKI